MTPLLAAGIFSQSNVEYLNQIFIFAIYAVSLNLLLGYAGQVSVAPAAFGAVGGYTVAYYWTNHHLGILPGTLLGMALALFLGLFIGVLCLRLSLVWLVVLTLALSAIVPDLIAVLQTPNLGQTQGLANISGLPFLGWTITQPTQFLPIAGVAALLVFMICHRMGLSPFGRVLRGIRDDQEAVQAAGKNIFRYKLQVFAITSAMAGLAGALSVVDSTVASPGTFGFNTSLSIFAMVIIGGMGNLWGSLLGATVITLSTPFFQDVIGINPLKASLWQGVAFGALLVIVIRLRPQGLLPARVKLRRTGLPQVERPITGVKTRAAADSSPDQVLVKIVGLNKSFGAVRAVRDVDIDLLKGRVTALVGPNGAGKTTVFNIVAGALRPDSGQVLIGDADLTSMRPDEIAAHGVVRSYQDVRLFGQLAVLENVALAVPGQVGESLTRVFGTPRSVRVREREVTQEARDWLDFVGYSGELAKPAGSLSYGEQKLVSLARVLATGSQVILLDEPASGVESSWVDIMMELIRRVRAEGRTICIVEHNMQVIEQVADVTYFMDAGAVVASGDIATLLHDEHLAEVYFGTG